MTQTGVQILTGFLLTVPFSTRFDDLTAFQRDVYLAVLAGVGADDRARRRPGGDASGALPHAPARAARRVGQPVRDGRPGDARPHRLRASCCSSSTSWSAAPAGWIAGGAILLVLTVLWAVVPRVADRLDPSPRNPPPSADDEPAS